MRAITAAAILAIAAFLGLVPAQAAEAPQTAPEAITSVQTVVSVTDTTKPPRRALEASEGQSCPGWVDVARDVGWPETELPMVGAITYFESRCQQGIRGDNGGSWTAFQIHTKSWCKPNKYWPEGWLQAQGIVANCKDLLNPETAARAALAIWQYGGWKQWTTWQKASTTIGQ